jgi:hypothetical protein
MRHLCRLIPAALLLLWAWIAPMSSAQSGAQADESAPVTCSALVDAAFSQAASSCGDLDRNTACYAFGDITATFANGDTAENEPEFSEPGDTTATATLENFITSAPDLLRSTLGFGIVNIQGDLPASLPQSVHMMLIGAAQLENGVPPDQALELPSSPFEVRVTSEANLYNLPDDDAPVVGQVGANTILQADGITANSLWLRVYYPSSSRVTAWVSRTWLEANLDTESLPVITPDSRSPMQRFFLSTEAPQATSPCLDEADAATLPPSLLLVQGPSGTQIRLTVNEVDLSTESTMAMQSDAEIGLRIFALDGEVRLFPDTPEELTVPTGSFVTFCQEGGLDLGIDNEEDDFRVGNDCAAGGVIQQCSRANEIGLDRLSLLPTSLLNKPVTLPAQCFASSAATGDLPEFVDICVRPGGIGSPSCLDLTVRYRPELIDPQTGQPVAIPQPSSTDSGGDADASGVSSTGD